MSDGTGAGDPEKDEARPPGGRDGADGAEDAPDADGREAEEGGDRPRDGSGASAGSDAPPADDAPTADDAPRRHPADETVRTDALPDAIRCPHCGEEDSEQFSSFGSAVSVSQYYCRSCRTVFEAFKWR